MSHDRECMYCTESPCVCEVPSQPKPRKVRPGQIWQKGTAGGLLVISVRKNVTVPGSLVTLVRAETFAVSQINNAKLRDEYSYRGMCPREDLLRTIGEMAGRIRDARRGLGRG